jgi:hypothetical protein
VSDQSQGQGQSRVGSIYMLYFFFRFLIDFDWIAGHLISDRIESGWVQIRSNEFDFS